MSLLRTAALTVLAARLRLRAAGMLTLTVCGLAVVPARAAVSQLTLNPPVQLAAAPAAPQPVASGRAAAGARSPTSSPLPRTGLALFLELGLAGSLLTIGGGLRLGARRGGLPRIVRARR